MKFYISKNLYFLKAILPMILVLTSATSSMYKAEYADLTLVTSIINSFFLFGGIYYLYKQSQVPLIELTHDDLKINSVLSHPVNESVRWELISGMKKSLFGGYKLFALGGEVRLPVSYLNASDRDEVLKQIKEKITQ